MRLILCSILIFSHTLSHARQTGPRQFLLNGKLEGKYSGFVYLNYLPGGGRRGITDSTRIKNGKFSFRGDLFSLAGRGHLSTFNGLDASVVFDEKNYSREFYLEPGVMTVTVSLNKFVDMQVTGSPIDSENVNVMKLRQPYFNDEKKLDQWDSLYIVQHPDSYMAADFLAGSSYSRIAFPSLEDLYNKLPQRIRHSDPGETIAFKIEQEKHLRTGIAAYDFSAPTDKGDTISLKDFKGKKYVLLDFWASWCVPCRTWSPYLKRIKDKYSNDLEIISISIEKDRDPWLKAIEEDKLVWPQVMSSSIGDMYLVSTIPAFVLIDKDSRIATKYGSFYKTTGSQTLDKELELILNK